MDELRGIGRSTSTAGKMAKGFIFFWSVMDNRLGPNKNKCIFGLQRFG